MSANKPTFSWSLFINSTSMAFSLTERETERERGGEGEGRREKAESALARTNGVWLAHHDRITCTQTDGR